MPLIASSRLNNAPQLPVFFIIVLVAECSLVYSKFMVTNLSKYSVFSGLRAMSVLFGAAFLTVSLCQAEDLAPLNLKLPDKAFAGTPTDIKVGPNVEPLSKTPRPPLMVPKDVKNLAPTSKISSNDTNIAPASLAKIIDGDKEAPNMVLLRKGLRYVQFDLGSAQELFAIVIWHAHDTAKVYHQVAVQLADDADFTKNVRTIFNNDVENRSGLGVGTDREYFESYEGKLVDPKGAKAQFVRLYSAGSTDSKMNEYTEVEIYGRPAK